MKQQNECEAFEEGAPMKPLYILAALAILTSCAHKRIQWESMDYGVIRAADSYREETHK